MSDISHLLAIMNRLVDTGNTVIVIEHNLDVIKNADWIIDMGPEGGNKGGKVMFEGTPKQLLTQSIHSRAPICRTNASDGREASPARRIVFYSVTERAAFPALVNENVALSLPSASS